MRRNIIFPLLLSLLSFALTLLFFNQEHHSKKAMVTFSENAIPNQKANIFAISEHVNIDTRNNGTWKTLAKNDQQVWQFKVQRPATSLNFGFSEFVLPASAVLKICNEEGERCQEFLPRKNQLHHLEMWTPIMKGGTSNFELYLNSSEKDLLRLRMTSINKGLEIDATRMRTQECLIDIVCEDNFPQISEWGDEIQSVGLISIEGTKLCSGVLLNNVLQDYTPYFLTARHCGINAQNAESVVVHWNYENTSCRFGAETNKEEGDGSLSTFNSGATFLADLQRSDFTLLKLNEAVEDEANAFFAGWSALPEPPVDVTTIHHANTDEKRITFGKGKTSITRHFGEAVDESLDHIKIEKWDISSTSGGSSGAPLFDNNHRVVGQLHGGLADCGNEESDWFGRFHTSWEGDEIPERQLKHWLDPNDSGLLELNGIWDDLEPLGLQVSILPLAEIICAGDSTAVIEINIANGAGPFQYSIDGGENFQNQNIFQNLSAGFYSVLVKDSDENTSAIVPFIVDEPEAIGLNYKQVYNQIEFSVVGGTPPFLFSLDGGITFDSVFTEVPLGINMFKVVDSEGCSTELELDVQYDAFQSQLVVLQEISCYDTMDGMLSIQHSGTVGPYTYQLNGGKTQTDNVFNNLGRGNYVGTVKDSLGNTIETSLVTLELPFALSADLVQIEENGSVMVNGGTEPYQYSYDGAAFTFNNQFLLSDDIEIIVVRDARGCEIELLNILSSNNPELVDSQLSLFPNPTSESITVSVGERQIVGYSIMDITGKLVKKGSLLDSELKEFTFDLTGFGKGTYIFQAKYEDGSIKVLKFNVL